jgi:membrane protease YdiL (CAAX protease family)
METRAIILLLSEWLGVVALALLFGISPRFRRKPLVFLYPLREGLVSIILFLVLLAAGFLVHASSRSSQAPDLAPRLWAALLALLVYGLALGLRRQPLRSAGWNHRLLGGGLRAGLALILFTLVIRGSVFRLLGGVGLELGWALLLWLGIALAEESVFRGYIQPRLKGCLGMWPGLLAAAVMFSLWQLPRLVGDPATLPLNMALALGQGLVLGFLMEKTGHVIVPGLYRTVSEWLFLV